MVTKERRIWRMQQVQQGIKAFPDDTGMISRRTMSLLRAAGFTEVRATFSSEECGELRASLPKGWLHEEGVAAKASRSVLDTLQLGEKTLEEMTVESMSRLMSESGNPDGEVIIDTGKGFFLTREGEDPISLMVYTPEKGKAEEPRLWMEFAISDWSRFGLVDVTDMLVTDYTETNRDDAIFVARLEDEEDPDALLQDLDTSEIADREYDEAQEDLWTRESGTGKIYFGSIHENLVNPTMIIPAVFRSRPDVVRSIRRRISAFGELDGNIHGDIVKNIFK